MKFLIAGLGNIGDEYAATRHNIGFMVMDVLATRHKAPAFKLERLAFITSFKYRSHDIYLIKPTTYMNLSGKAIRYWMQDLKVETKSLLAVTDDLAIPFGTLRMKGKGSNGGHNGLGNIQEVLATVEYPRLRFGIGADFAKGAQVNYVLNPFTKDEQLRLPALIERSADMVESFIFQGLERTMNMYNK